MSLLSSQVSDSKPNILFILIDDLGWKDLACYGSDFYETPRLDQLAQEGMQFTNAYASCPVCSPTRASVMTGQYPARLGVTQWLGGFSEGKLAHVPYIDHLSTDHLSVAAALKQGGYKTWHVGKWHLSTHGENKRDFYPEKHGFDLNIGGCDWGHPLNGYFSPYNIETLENGPEGEYLTDRITDEAINLIKKGKDAPWFMHLSHYAVHTPIECHEELIKKYQQKSKRLGLDKIYPFVQGESFPCFHLKDKHVLRRVIQSDPVYAAMIENLDWNIGRTLDALEESGQSENTIVIFYSDNGGLATAEGSPTCNAPLSEGKGWMYEGGTREPLLVKWPKVIKPNQRCSEPVTSTDFFPLFLDAAKLPLLPEHHLDGVSILPLLEGNTSFSRGPIFWHYPHYSNQGGSPGASIRDGKWKLIKFFEDNHVELYDLEEDISESKDLSLVHSAICDELHKKLCDWQYEVEASIPRANPGYEKEFGLLDIK
ncbi:sulfatase [Marinomonas flavescens]|uniref:sulfatase n=1 Tax=Marinomonas flavescens TaxID=2529379 RepID=UPI001056DE78|nr:sulfatase [Marinomonas flavescens]